MINLKPKYIINGYIIKKTCENMQVTFKILCKKAQNKTNRFCETI